MKIIINFMMSAAASQQFPASPAPEVAFLGRSNVGKSSLLNSLTGTRMARVSNTPGRTQTINFFAIHFGVEKQEPALVLSDLPGYGYARAPKAIVSEWPKFIEPYLESRETLGLCIVLVDASVPPQASDVALIEWLGSAGREFQVVATKADRLSGNKLTESLKKLRAALGAEVMPYSSKTGKGKEELWRKIRQTLEARSTSRPASR